MKRIVEVIPVGEGCSIREGVNELAFLPDRSREWVIEFLDILRVKKLLRPEIEIQ